MILGGWVIASSGLHPFLSLDLSVLELTFENFNTSENEYILPRNSTSWVFVLLFAWVKESAHLQFSLK
jgi:hypothetical protein